MKFLNGWKTILGAVITVIGVVAPRVSPDSVAMVGDHVVGIVQGVGGLLTVLGLIHKREKAAASK